MSKKFLIVGGVAGGASTAARLRRLDEKAEIIIFEKGPNVSFSNCSLPFHLSGIVENSDKLILMTPQGFQTKYNIEARVQQEVVRINREKKTITIKDLKTNRDYEESYDTLILSPGASPIVPDLEGIHSKHVFTIRNVADIDRLNWYLQTDNVQDIAVVGGGFIGVEVAENLKLAGYNVSLVEFGQQIMAPFDYDMAQILHKEMTDKGVQVIVNDGLAKVTPNNVTLNSGKQLKAQAVVLAIGVRPEIRLAKEAGLTIGELGGIQVDANYVTSDPSIYAVGDAIEVFHQLTHKQTRLALAGPAQRQARAAANHMYNIPHHNKGVIGSSSVQIFDLVCATTGLNEKTALANGFQAKSVYLIAPDKVGLMPNSNPLHFKLVYETPTGKILGAQAIGKGNADKRIDVIATLITMGGTLEDLKELELSYSPMFSTARDIVNLAALVAQNLLHGHFKQVKVDEVRELIENQAFFLDVREKNEFESGHLINAHNIPLSELRERMDEIPKDQAVYVHCRSGQRSYNAVMALQNSGFSNVFNVSGSFLGICLYEYFTDITTNRDKIVTAYNFK
ncbi:MULTISPECIES: FAD-dependent oxidoreductase [Lysinibacillus]|uniref:FAD-dependent pyridine nucleotide-disulfide oxidoreductase n=1 Tax=Lysinibacillus capsici TaxID=2115968 RepID=A0A2X0XE94_9BACI|nr:MULTISPECIES: FAD-dependent oxidoreductase [Lysinibacillus]KMN38849.1 pyridine nucleotide-disulfide oxidoreductase [Lysinibacillus sp. LK3]MCR6524277.1 FAD-dependent oxidoreductase [Lysinibacillus capsici]MED3876815.1 FAD-dependent oxidoreductase [Lysinibacillus capsici]SPT97385.1 FAD-dependent pyridine nucleotide-disulfide oxidoreductase [Lysinibacillus capsici]